MVSMPAKEDLKSKKIPHVRSLEFENGMITLSLDVGESELENKVPDRIISLIEDKIAAQSFGGKAEHWNPCGKARSER